MYSPSACSALVALYQRPSNRYSRDGLISGEAMRSNWMIFSHATARVTGHEMAQLSVGYENELPCRQSRTKGAVTTCRWHSVVTDLPTATSVAAVPDVIALATTWHGRCRLLTKYRALTADGILIPQPICLAHWPGDHLQQAQFKPGGLQEDLVLQRCAYRSRQY